MLMILQKNVFPPNFANKDTEQEKECTSSRISGVGSRVSGTAKTFVNEREGLLRTDEVRPLWVEDESNEGSRETLSLVEEGEELGTTKDGNKSEDTVETAMEGFDFSLLLPL